MPVFEYKCCNCGENFKLYRKLVWSDKQVKCPKCGAQHPMRAQKNLWDKFLFIFEGGAPTDETRSGCLGCSSATT